MAIEPVTHLEKTIVGTVEPVTHLEKVIEQYGGGGGGGSVTVDSALSDTSENPVQNKVIKAALDGKVGNKTYICTNFDSAETYAVGDYVMYSSALYECTTAHTGAWNASHFTAVTLNEGDLICNTDENSSVAWSDITGKPTIPTAVSQLTNDSRYQTAAQVTAAINSALGVIENGSY